MYVEFASVLPLHLYRWCFTSKSPLSCGSNTTVEVSRQSRVCTASATAPSTFHVKIASGVLLQQQRKRFKSKSPLYCRRNRPPRFNFAGAPGVLLQQNLLGLTSKLPLCCRCNSKVEDSRRGCLCTAAATAPLGVHVGVALVLTLHQHR
ncbi:hypothetical protein KIN20_033782 [Parelaphostrongylus tenuis]|uniref:Uncharacterized protein n=1 Tax=Parelaphostrongylus tenuis TaxID=148309 RepID=A0AAD5R8W6_PARTN|nr:hypothetical protein KIN20_033782 [Parelaphostrongylus tenuis]